MFHLAASIEDDSKLFSSAIVQSGALSFPFARTDKHPAVYARRLAKEVGCGKRGGGEGEMTSTEIKECLREVSCWKKQPTVAGTFKCSAAVCRNTTSIQ